ncbi:MAG TPA: stage V sporulation protein AE, partial [Clostridiaceae bacterium]|nr:stage V sporulation protein AE [Clostridiaceae bacterium]
MEKRKVILVTDGDSVAKEAVEIAASNIGARCISDSAGNPTVLTGQE